MIYIILFLILELFLSLEVGSNIGFLWTVIWIVTTFVVGIGLIQNAHTTMQANMQSLRQGKLNPKSFHDSATSFSIFSLI
jgi:2-isopropylmalate synthase/UPF0716 protein FxsA